MATPQAAALQQLHLWGPLPPQRGLRIDGMKYSFVHREKEYSTEYYPLTRCAEHEIGPASIKEEIDGYLHPPPYGPADWFLAAESTWTAALAVSIDAFQRAIRKPGVTREDLKIAAAHIKPDPRGQKVRFYYPSSKGMPGRSETQMASMASRLGYSLAIVEVEGNPASISRFTLDAKHSSAPLALPFQHYLRG